MRYSRVLMILGLVAAVALGAALLVRGSRSAAHPVRVFATTRRSHHRNTLRQQLQPLLVKPFGRVVPPYDVQPGGPCFVQGGGCSETPCVYFVQGGWQPPTIVSGEGLGRVIPVRPAQPRASSCPGGRRATPHTLRVGASVPVAIPRP